MEEWFLRRPKLAPVFEYTCESALIFVEKARLLLQYRV